MTSEEEEIIADFVGDKKGKPPAKKLVIEEKDFSDPGLKVYWLESVGARYRVISAKLVPVPESAKTPACRTPPGMTKEIVLSDSLPFLEKYIEACGKSASDYVMPLNNKSLSRYVYTTSIEDVTIFALKFFLDRMIETIPKEGDEERATETTAPTSTES